MIAHNDQIAFLLLSGMYDFIDDDPAGDDNVIHYKLAFFEVFFSFFAELVQGIPDQCPFLFFTDKDLSGLLLLAGSQLLPFFFAQYVFYIIAG